MLKSVNSILFSFTADLQGVDQADTTDSEQTEALNSTRLPDDTTTDKQQEQQDNQSPRSSDPQHTEKVMLLS